MENHACLNCDEPLQKHFCANCGQKSDTHRITFWHFIAHDLLHGVWHIEKGMLFTLKEAIVRPGKAALDYVSGKRIKYYNVFYLSLLVIALDILLNHYANDLAHGQVDDLKNDKLFNFFAHYIKFILFGLVPAFALNANLIFKRLKLNLAEHFVIAGMGLLSSLIVSVLYFVSKIVLATPFLSWLFSNLKALSALLIFLFPIWLYANAARPKYSVLGFSWRMLAFYVLFIVEFLLFLITTMAVIGSEQLNVNI